jgi:hypothetical protein
MPPHMEVLLQRPPFTTRINALMLLPLKPFLQNYWNFDEICIEMKIVFECEMVTGRKCRFQNFFP